MDNINLIEMFSFTEKEKKIWKPLSDYSEKIDNWMKQNSMTEDQLIRFVLIGFFVEYRASNHRGDSFNTDIQNRELTQLKITKYNIVNSLLGRAITSTQDYLTLIKLVDMKNLSGEALYHFVIDNDTI